MYKPRVLLLRSFDGYLTETVVTIALDTYREAALLKASTLAVKSLERMQLHDLYAIEAIDAQFVNQDQQLIDAGNGLNISPDLSQQEMLETTTMHKVVFAYLEHKYK